MSASDGNENAMPRTPGQTGGQSILRRADLPRRPKLEVLEDRLAPAAFIVDRTTDGVNDGDVLTRTGSLRFCLGQANSVAYPGLDTISITTTGTIALSSELHYLHALTLLDRLLR